jgi:hypothetical protein
MNDQKTASGEKPPAAARSAARIGLSPEEAGGIMSAIDPNMNLEWQPDRKGDRVRIRLFGKFLPHKRF